MCRLGFPLRIELCGLAFGSLVRDGGLVGWGLLGWGGAGMGRQAALSIAVNTLRHFKIQPRAGIMVVTKCNLPPATVCAVWGRDRRFAHDC